MTDKKMFPEIDVLKWITEDGIFDKDFHETISFLGDLVDYEGDGFVGTKSFKWAGVEFGALFHFEDTSLFLLSLEPIFEYTPADKEQTLKETEEKETKIIDYLSEKSLTPLNINKTIWLISDYRITIRKLKEGDDFTIDIINDVKE